MAGMIISGTYTSGIVLSNPATQRQVTVTGAGKIASTAGDGIFGDAAFPWTVSNAGTVGSAPRAGQGIQLLAGGAVNNSAGGLISGYNSGILVKGAPGSIANLGKIQAAGTNGSGVDLTAGGRVANGSAAATAAQITGGHHAILITGASGTVTNFGTLAKSFAGAGGTVVLTAGGSVTNASRAHITGSGAGNAVYVDNGLGTVTNFGTISSRVSGVFLVRGGRVANGRSGSAGGLISSRYNQAILIGAAAGTVTNFGTLRATGTVATVALSAGGSVTNGASGAAGAAILSTASSGVYINNAAGSVTNFGKIAATGAATGSSTLVLRAGGSVANFGSITNAGTGASVYVLGRASITNGAAALIGGASTGISVRGAAGSITNFGRVRGSTSTGVYLQLGGTVGNRGAATISGSGYGIEARSGRLTVGNLGTIAASGAAGHGIGLLDDGTVTNGRSGSAAGLISGASAGVYMRFKGGTVTNFGTIRGNIGFLALGSADTTLTNFGTVASTAGAGGVAVDMGNSLGGKLLVVEPGAEFVGAVRGGGRGRIEFVGAGVARMTGVSGFETVVLADGASHRLTLTSANFNGVSRVGITVVGGNAGNTVIATGGSVTISGGAGKDVLTGGSANDFFQFTAAALQATDIVKGGGGLDDELRLTTAGTVAASGVSAVEIYRLANGGANTLVLRNANFTDVLGGHISVFGGSGGNTIDGSRITGAADNLIVRGGAGRDAAKGGAGDDIFSFSAAQLAATDIVEGGKGEDELLLTTAGLVHADGVDGVESYVLPDSGANTLTLRNANFAGVTGSRITVIGGDAGNTASAAGATGGTVTMDGGAGRDVFTGSDGNDRFVFSAATLGAADIVTGGGGSGDRLQITTAGAIAAGGVSGVEIYRLAGGRANTLALQNANFAGISGGHITVDGGSRGNTIDGSTITAAADNLIVQGGAGRDVVKGGAGNDTFSFTASGLAATDIVTGGSGKDELVVTTAGRVAARGVSGVEIYRLADGAANTLVLKNANFTGTGGRQITVDGGGGGNTIDGSGVTAAADRLVVFGGAGRDVVKGGAGDDTFSFTAAALTGSDLVNGGRGKDELALTTAGTVHADGVSRVENYVLADGGANALTLKSGNFAGVAGGAITITDGDGGTTLSAAAVPAADHVVVFAGAGIDKLTGGAGPDVFHAGGRTTMTGKGGADEFVFVAPGANRVADFSAAAGDEIVVGNDGFDLGLFGRGPTPTLLPASYFTKNATGVFTSAAQRFAYATASGKLFFSASGTTAGETLVATLTGAPGLDHLFVFGSSAGSG